MRQRQVRKGQGQQTKDSFDVNAKIPAYEKERIAVHETIKKSGTYGCTAGDLYKACTEIDPRRIREAVQSLKGRNEITGEKCRCGCATVYTLKDL